MTDTRHTNPGHSPHLEGNVNNLSQNFDLMLNVSNDEEDQTRHVIPFRPLIDFVKYHTKFITPDPTSGEHDCPICQEPPSKSHERILQIDLPLCKHIFGADCLETYIQRSNTCPMCREVWFTKRISGGPYHVQILVSNNNTANLLRAGLQTYGNELLEQILDDPETYRSDSDDDTYSESSDSSGRPDSMVVEVSNYSPLVDNHTTATVEGLSSETTSESISGTSGVSRREMTQSLEISDEELFTGAVDWVGDKHRSASDDEALAPPRQRRRYE